MSEEDRDAYYAGLKAYRDNMNTFNTAIREAREESREEGPKKGLIEGEANKEKYAEEKAREREKQSKLEIAKKCLERGMPITGIADLTGLTEDEISDVTF